MKRFFIFLSLALTVMLAAAPSEVKVSSFAPGKDDATAAFNAAIATGAKKVIVDDPGFPYIIRPVILRSDLELVFMDKVVVRAKRGEFHGQGDSLFKATDVRNITIRGEGNVILEMNKSDYQDSSKYSWSEWRMCLSFRGCENVVIRNLTLKSSGGDGIYIGAHKNPGCKNVLIENVRKVCGL
jgi:polygalacturonase